eukprot:14013_1
MTEFFTSIKDDLKGIAEAQAQQATTIELFDELLANKPDDYDSNCDSKKLWDSIIENTQNTMNDIKMVDTLKDNYIEDFVEITDAMNNVESEADTVELSKKIKKMSQAQEKYKKKIMEATKNALESLKTFMKENVTKEELDSINNDITKYQKLDFEAEQNINSLQIEKSTELKKIDKNIEGKKGLLKECVDKKHDIEDELDRILKLKLGRQHAKKLGFNMNDLLTGRANLRSVRCNNVHSAYGSRVCECCYMKQWYSWKVNHRSQILEEGEGRLRERSEELKMQRNGIELKIAYYEEERHKKEMEYTEKINNETANSIQYKKEFKNAMTKLNDTVKKTGVDEDKLNDFVELTQTVIPSIMEEQNSLNKLSKKCTSSYSLFVKGITPKKDRYIIEQYLKDRNQYNMYLDIYIKALSQFNMRFMHQIQCVTKQKFENKILPILKKRFVYYPSNNCGVYGVFNVHDTEIPSKVLHTFANICCNNAHWSTYYKSSDANVEREKTKKFTSKFGSILGKYQKKQKVRKINQNNFILSSFELKSGSIKCFDDSYNELHFTVDQKDKDLIDQIVNTQNIGIEMKQDVYITVNEIIYSNKKKKQSVIKAFIKDADKINNKLRQKLEQQQKEMIQQKEREMILEKEVEMLKGKLARDSDQTQNEMSIEKWLTDVVRLPEYISNFVDNGFDMEILNDTTKEDLKEIGIKKLGHIKKILKAIESMK